MRGMGRVYRRGEIYWVQFSRDGRVFRESTKSASIQFARFHLKRRLAQITMGSFSPLAEKLTVGDLIQRVFQDYELHDRRSIDHARRRWKLHLSSEFNYRTAAMVDETDVREYMLKRRAEKASNASINREVALLKRALRLGKLRLDVPKLTETNVRKGFVTEKDAGKLARECSKHGLWMRALFAILFEFGFRRGEALGLRVGQIDLQSRTVRLEAGETKSGEGRSAVMTSSTFELIRACCDGKKPDEHVFTRNRTPVKSIRGVWSTITQDAGLPGLLVHDLRRSAIRRMIQRGIPQHVAMRISGHKTVSVFHRYAIVAQSDLADASRRLEELAH